MPRVPAHLQEHALDMLQGGIKTADVARAINCHVRTVKRLRLHYRERGRTADHPRSGRPRVTTPAEDQYIRTSQLQDRYRMGTTTARVTPGMHNPSISAQTVWNRLDWRLVGLLSGEDLPYITGNNVTYGHKPIMCNHWCPRSRSGKHCKSV